MKCPPRNRRATAFDKLNGKGILKTRRFGYDGKGQAKVTSAVEAEAAFASFKGAPAILEGFVDFSYEASVVAARGADGQFAAYDPPENEHEHHILRRSTVPSRLNAAQVKEAKAIAKAIGDALDYVGVFAVELFVRADGELLVNEIAPRVHNTGHWTIEACQCSQFEQHIRAVAGWPLGDPGAPCRCGDGEYHRRRSRCLGKPGQNRGAAPLWQGAGPAGPQNGPCHAD